MLFQNVSYSATIMPSEALREIVFFVNFPTTQVLFFLELRETLIQFSSSRIWIGGMNEQLMNISRVSAS
jgi:hypothetical protein